MSFSGNPTTFVERQIENDGFWPNLSLMVFQEAYRLPGEYLVETLVDGLTTAMIEVNQDLANHQSQMASRRCVLREIC